MTGFLPILNASNGTAPSTAADTTTPQAGAEGAFGAVLAGLMGGTDADAAAAQDLTFGDAAPGFTAGSALQRLKLAFADAGTLPGRAMAHTALASRVTMFDIAPATLEFASAETGTAADPALGDGGKAAVDPQSIVPPAPAETTDAAADEALEMVAADASALAALAAAQPQPATRTEVSPGFFGGDTGIDMPPAAAGNAEAAGHALSDMAEARPQTAAATAQPSQASQDEPNAAEDAASAVAAVSAQVARRAGPETVAIAEDAAAPGIGQAASALRETAGEQRRTGTAFTANANVSASSVNAGAGLAGVAIVTEAATEGLTGGLTGLTAEAPEQAASSVLAAKSAAQNMTAETKPGTGALPMIEPAAGDAPEVAEARSDADADDAAEPARLARNAEQQQAQTSGGQSLNPASNPAAQSAQSTQAAALPEGFQPVHAQPLHSQTQGQPGLPHGADVVRVATPQQLPEAVGIAISRHVGAEATEFTLRLDPAELGRIEVKLEMGKDGQATVSIRADDASTYDLLRRDSSALERALAEAGLKLDSGGLNFSLRQQDGQNQQQFAGENAQRQATGRMQEASLAGLEQDNTPRPTRRSGAPGLLDLSI